MNKYRIEITKPAENDLSKKGMYIAKELLEPSIAETTINKISGAILTLEEFPYQNALVAEERLGKQGIRKIIIDNYIAFYMVEENHKIVTVIRILYGKRNWMNLL